MTIGEFEEKCYGAYQLDWMISHGYGLDDLSYGLDDLRDALAEACEAAKEAGGAKDVDGWAGLVEDAFLERGFGSGSIFACEAEFLGHEYLDEGYMEHLTSLMPEPQKMMERWHKAVEGKGLKAVQIEWDTDGEDVSDYLPDEVDIPDGMTDMEEISDYLSDEYGFCHFGFFVELD